MFWVRQKNEKVSFDQLNLYAHSLSDAFVDVSLLGRNLTVENAKLLKPQDTAGDVSIQGAVPKAWIKRDGQFICGFSMETENMLENSQKKLKKKNVDMIVANNLRTAGAGFGTDTNVVTLITADSADELPKMSKEDVAHAILDKIIK